MILILSILLILFQIIFALNKSVFWHISDFHLNDVYYKQANCYQDHPFANYRCDSSLKLIQSSLAFLKDKTKKEKPDFIVMTGDNGPHLDNLDKSSTLKTIALVTKEYEKYLDPSIPFIPIVGNHDVFPVNEMDADPKSKLSAISWCTELEMKWSKYINESGPLPKSDFSKGCYYSRYIKQGDFQLIITSLNGLVWYHNNKYAEPGVDDTIDTYDPLGQFAWLKSIFKWARKNKAKVINTNHFPLGSTINSPQVYRNMWPLANEKLVKLYREYSDVISAHLVAHEHVDSFRVLLDESNQKAVGMFLLAPSIDPFEFKNFGAFNPRMRKFIYDNTTGQILNYQQYVLDISSAEKIEEGWKEDYDFLSAYDQTELKPNSLLDIVNSFEDDFDYRNHWSFYWDSELGHTKRKGDCAEVPKMLTKCRCEHICAFKFLTYPELNNCLSLCPSNSNLRKIIFMVFGVGVILVGMVVIIIINKRRKKDQLEVPILDDEQNMNI